MMSRTASAADPTLARPRYIPIAHLPMAKGADVVAFDPGLGRIYVACSIGAISVFQEDDPDHFRKLEDFPVEKKVHSLAVDVRTHRVYAPEEQEGGQPVARMVIFEAIAGAPAVSPRDGQFPLHPAAPVALSTPVLSDRAFPRRQFSPPLRL